MQGGNTRCGEAWTWALVGTGGLPAAQGLHQARVGAQLQAIVAKSAQHCIEGPAGRPACRVGLQAADVCRFLALKQRLIRTQHRCRAHAAFEQQPWPGQLQVRTGRIGRVGGKSAATNTLVLVHKAAGGGDTAQARRRALCHTWLLLDVEASKHPSRATTQHHKQGQSRGSVIGCMWQRWNASAQKQQQQQRRRQLQDHSQQKHRSPDHPVGFCAPCDASCTACSLAMLQQGQNTAAAAVNGWAALLGRHCSSPHPHALPLRRLESWSG